MRAMFRFLMITAFLIGYGHHVVHCYLTGKWIALVFGAVVFPAGVLHGYGLWFGWF